MLTRRTAVVWVGLIVVAIALAIHGVTNAGGETAHDVLENWVSDAAVWTVAIMCLVAAVRARHNRAAWFLVATALVLWAIGDTLWSLRGDPDVVTSISDVFWLAWYPLIVAALVLLVRDRVPGFELHRWIDGVVVMLVVATPWVALILQPAAEHSSANTLADAVDFAYPLGDAIVVGATLGVLALMGWRAGPMWTALCAGVRHPRPRRRHLLGRRPRPLLQRGDELRCGVARRHDAGRVRRVAAAPGQARTGPGHGVEGGGAAPGGAGLRDHRAAHQPRRRGATERQHPHHRGAAHRDGADRDHRGLAPTTTPRPGRGHPARSRRCPVPLPNRRGSSSSSRIRVWSGSERMFDVVDHLDELRSWPTDRLRRELDAVVGEQRRLRTKELEILRVLDERGRVDPASG